MAPRHRLGSLVLTISVAIAVGVTGWWLGIGPAGDESGGVQSVAEFQIDANYPLCRECRHQHIHLASSSAD